MSKQFIVLDCACYLTRLGLSRMGDLVSCATEYLNGYGSDIESCYTTFLYDETYYGSDADMNELIHAAFNMYNYVVTTINSPPHRSLASLSVISVDGSELFLELSYE